MTGCLIKEVTIKAAWQRYYKSSRAMNRLNSENFSIFKIATESTFSSEKVEPSESSLTRQGRRHEDLKL